jgi:glycosyltransferase involved in cell wall biosynthesis
MGRVIMPLLSVAIPTYNGADTILETIRSVDQEGINEIVISDNCSTDNTKTLIRELQNDKIKYFRNDQNVGFDRNCDLAVKRATGDYVWLFSDDDILQPNAAKKIVSILSQYPNLSVVSVNHSIQDYSLKYELIEQYNPHTDNRLTYGLDEFLSVVWKHHSLMSTNIIRREDWVNTGSSWFIGCKFIHVGKIYEFIATAYYIAEPLVICRSGNNRITYTPDKILNTELNVVQLLIDSHADRQIVRTCITEFMKTLPNKIIWVKRINCSLKDFKPLFKYFWSSPYFLIVCLPLILLPCNVYHSLAQVRYWLNIKPQ